MFPLPLFFFLFRFFPPPKQSDQSCSRTQACRANTALLVATHREYCVDLLHLLHHLRHTRCSGSFVAMGKDPEKSFLHFISFLLQLFKGALYYCGKEEFEQKRWAFLIYHVLCSFLDDPDGPKLMNVTNKTDCLADPHNTWINRKYNFDNLGQVSARFQPVLDLDVLCP